MYTHSTINYMAIQAEQDRLDLRARRGWMAAQAAAGEERPHGVDSIRQTARRWFAGMTSMGRIRPAQVRLPGRAG